MVLALTAINPLGQTQEFLLDLDSLESGLDFLSILATQGNMLIKVCILDEYSSMSLPVESFDGQPFSPEIKQLEQQWQQALRDV